MYDLTYNLLVDRVAKKKALIFSLIATSPVPVSINYLEEHSKFSKRTISDYIVLFNSEQPYGMEISLNGKNKFSLQAKKPSAISLYLNTITEANPLFNIIELIYSSTTETVDSLVEKLYLSHSSVKRYLSHLKNELKKYKLRLQLTPNIELRGDECTIRYFFFRYFRYVFDNSVLPTQPHQTEMVYNTLSKLIDDSGFALSIDYTRAVNWISIFEQRIKNGYSVHFPEHIMNLHRNSDSFSRFKKAFIPNFKNNPNINSISEHELMYVYIMRLDTLTYERHSTFFYADYTSELAHFEPLVSDFFAKQVLHPGLYINLKIALQAFLMNTTFLTDLAPFFQELDNELHIQVQHNHQEILNNWLTVLNQHDMKFEFLKDVAVGLTLITISALQMSSKKDLKVLFSFSGDPSTITYYKSIAIKVVPRDAEVIFVFNKQLTNEFLDMLSIDVCIVNFRIQDTITACTLVRLSPIPLEVEWLTVLSYLYDGVD